MAWRSSLPNLARRARWDTLDLDFLTLDLGYVSSTLLYYIFYMYICFFFFFFAMDSKSDCSVFPCLTDKNHVSPWLSLTNVPALN